MIDVLAQVAWIAFFSIAAQWLGWRLKTPSIVFLLLGGVWAGPILGVVQPQVLLGDLLNPLISLAVGVILFEGALNLNFKQIREAQKAVRRVIVLGAPVAWALTTGALHYIAGMSLPVSLTFGALLIVTGPTVIIPLLKDAHLKERPASILKWEGIINDPIGAVLAILCYEYFKLAHLEHMNLPGFFSSTALAIVMISFFGILGAWVITWLFNRDIVPEYLKPTFLLTTTLVYFVLCNTIQHDFGLIGVTIFGVALANMGMNSLDEIKRFKETLSIMLVSGVFILLTANIDPGILLGIDWRGVAFIIALLFIIRPITMMISSAGTELSWKEVILTGWIAPRGIVCAAVAGVLGPYLVDIGYEDGHQILPLAFAIVIFTVFLHGLSAKPLATRLGLAYTGKDSLIIVGSTEWAAQLSRVLRERSVEVIMADKNWHALKPARLSSIPVYYGEILSEETEFNLELARYNMILAITNNPAYNALICNKFSHEFGRDKVYQFLPHEDDEHERKKISHNIRGRTFGPRDMDFWDITGLYMQGWRFKTSRAGKAENIQKIAERSKSGEIRIFGMISPKGKIDLRAPQNFENVETESLFILFTDPAADVEQEKDDEDQPANKDAMSKELLGKNENKKSGGAE